MFEDLYDAVSMLFRWWWPITDAEITDVMIDRGNDRSPQDYRLSVCYKFYVGNDGPYCGESFWKPTFTAGIVKRLRDAKEKMRAKRMAPVRYRPDDPSLNRLDRDAWRGL